MGDIWTPGQLGSIGAMLNPRSIAVIGATPRMQYGGRFLTRVLAYKNRVRIYPVNLRHAEIFGERCYAGVADLPEAPDVAVVVVPYHAVLATLRECHGRGTRSAIVISAGFSERGDADRAALQAEIGAFATESGMRFSGPNCLGLANVRDDLWLTSSSRVERGIPGPVGIVCQSGASLFGPLLARAMDMGLGVSYAVSTGNEADLEFADFVRYMIDDPGTKVITGFIEGFKTASKVVEVAKLAAEHGKPMVLIKIGRSDLGTRAASSHTGALTGQDSLYDAVFSQFGVIRVANYDDLLETAQLLARTSRPVSRGVAVVSHSGGVSSLTADMCGQAGLDLPPLDDAAQRGIDEIVKGFGWAANPADVTGKANSPEFPAIMDHLVEQPAVGALVVASAGADTHADQVIALRDRSPKAVVYLWTGSRSAAAGLPRLRDAAVPIFNTPDALARGLRAWQGYHAWRDGMLREGFASAPPASPAQRNAVGLARAPGRAALSESESKGLIKAWGVTVAGERLVHSAAQAEEAAASLGWPVVLKVDTPDIPHKTEAGIVRVGVRDKDALRTAYDAILAAAHSHDPDAAIHGVTVQKMVTGGVEVIVGLTYDAQLGPTLLFGLGGVLVEVYRDVALRRCPISPAQAHEMIEEVRGARQLHGVRGRPAADIPALAAVLVAVSHLGVQLDGALAEMDINPLMVLPAGQGVMAVDAFVRFKE